MLYLKQLTAILDSYTKTFTMQFNEKLVLAVENFRKSL